MEFGVFKCSFNAVASKPGLGFRVWGLGIQAWGIWYGD